MKFLLLLSSFALFEIETLVTIVVTVTCYKSNTNTI